MNDRLELERYRSERGFLLLLLIEDSSEWTHIDVLRSMMDRRGYPLSLRTLHFHLRYMLDSGYIRVKRLRDMEQILGKDEALSPADIVGITYTPKGTQLANRAIKDPEVLV